MTHRLHPYPLVILLITLCATLMVTVHAQDDRLPLTRSAEYDIGLKCPVSVSLDPTQTVIWVLMDNCDSGKFELRGFNIADGSPVEAAADHFAEALAPLNNQVIYAPTAPLAFTPDGTVDVIYNDLDSYNAHNLRLSLTSEPLTDSSIIHLSRDRVEQLIPAYAGYLETTVYNTSHTLAIVADTATFHMIDLQAGAELFQLEAQPETYGSYPSFSADSKTLYITTLKNIDNVQDYNAVLKVYSLPDGVLKASYDVPSFIL